VSFLCFKILQAAKKKKIVLQNKELAESANIHEILIWMETLLILLQATNF